jgi:cellulose synthase/poly-beta-1,6-N-acetylglucosamine synthase-like glycosyltransferase
MGGLMDIRRQKYHLGWQLQSKPVFLPEVPYIIIACTIVTLAYTCLMVLYRIGWARQKDFIVPTGFIPSTRISVIIPARNEAANIGPCVASLLKQDYPSHLFEIVIVDDHSEDGTAEVASQADDSRIKVLSLKELLPQGERINSYKKKALSTGISHSTGDLIVTTDADCIAGEHWLNYIAALYEQQDATMIIGPVVFDNKAGLLATFQSLDFTTMQGITVAARQLHMGSMANGANLAFRRQAFEAVKGYDGIDHLASGDDYLLLYKLQQRYPEGIHYLKTQQAVIRTAPQPTWSEFLQQRIRWASKSGKYSDHRLTAILLLVYAFNVSVLTAWISTLWVPGMIMVASGMLGVKIVIELFFLYPVARFFNNQHQLQSFPLLQPLHIVYIVLAGFLGLLGDYQWKGRSVK